VSLLCLCPVVAGCGATESELEFPYKLKIADGNHLFVMGRHLGGDVILTWEKGDSVRIEGMAVYPSPRPPALPLPADVLEETYGRVPFIVGLVNEGTSWAEASDRYEARRRDLGTHAKEVYRKALDSGVSEEAASQVALDSLDISLFDPSFDIDVRPAAIIVRWKGLPGLSVFMLDQEPGEPRAKPDGPQAITEGDAMAFLKAVSGRLEGRTVGRWMEVFSTHHFTVSGAAVGKALDQIARSRPDSLAGGPLCDHDLALILKVNSLMSLPERDF
jgi:hypothetical protein